MKVVIILLTINLINIINANTVFNYDRETRDEAEKHPIKDISGRKNLDLVGSKTSISHINPNKLPNSSTKDNSDISQNDESDTIDKAEELAEERRVARFKKRFNLLSEKAAKLTGCKPGFALFKGKCVDINKMDDDNRAAFAGDDCPTGLFKLNGLCIEED